MHHVEEQERPKEPEELGELVLRHRRLNRITNRLKTCARRRLLLPKERLKRA